jgi:streptogramin lyase
LKGSKKHAFAQRTIAREGTFQEVPVRTHHLLSSVAAVAGMLFMAVPAQAQNGPTLSGVVNSPEGMPMEGVLVTAKKDGATVATTVVTDAQGHYTFPAGRLTPGHYQMAIRAVGFNLSGPRDLDVADNANTFDIKLRKTGNLSAQLANGEWLLSMPGTEQQKSLLGDCMGCHELRLITGSVYTAADFERLIPLMGTYYPGSRPGRKQVLPMGPRGNRGVTNQKVIEAAAKYLETVNLSQTGQYTYELKTLPRPSGRATKMIVTTYDLPRPEAEPHDVIVVDGTVYYSDFGSMYIGEMDPATGKVTDYQIPVLKPSAPQGTLGLHADYQHNIWVALMYQGGLAKFDTKTKKLTTYPIPAAWQNASTQESMVGPKGMEVDGKVWTNDQSDHTFLRLDVATGKYEKFPMLRDQNGDTINGYELPAEPSTNNLYALEFGGAGTKIGMVDAKTGLLTTYKSPFARARPRRGQFDAEGVLWFAEYGANAIASFDPETQVMKEWVLPTAWSQPYDAVKSERTGEVWTGGMSTDRVTRFNPKTGEFVNYLLPDSTNIRRVWFDDPTNTFWVGANHRPAILKLEPLD